MSVLSSASRRSRASRVGVGFVIKGDTEEHNGGGSYDEKEVDKEQETAVQTAPDGTEITFPDGGLQAWLCVVGGAGTLFCAFGLSAAAGAFQTYYSTHQLAAYSSSSVSWIGSVMILADLHEGKRLWNKETRTYSLTSGPRSPTKMENSGPRSSRLQQKR